MPGDGIQIFMNQPEMVEGTGEADLFEPGEWGIPQTDGGLGAGFTYTGGSTLPTLTAGGAGVTYIPAPPGASAAQVCGGSDWISLGYPTKQAWKQSGKSCAPYQGVSPLSCPPGFFMDMPSGQCMPSSPALPPAQVIPGTGGQAGWCQQIPAGQPGSCLSPISQGQIGTVPQAISTTSGVLSQVEGFFFQHSTLILVGAALYFLWPTLTKKRR